MLNYFHIVKRTLLKKSVTCNGSKFQTGTLKMFNENEVISMYMFTYITFHANLHKI